MLFHKKRSHRIDILVNILQDEYICFSFTHEVILFSVEIGWGILLFFRYKFNGERLNVTFLVTYKIDPIDIRIIRKTHWILGTSIKDVAIQCCHTGLKTLLHSQVWVVSDLSSLYPTKYKLEIKCSFSKDAHFSSQHQHWLANVFNECSLLNFYTTAVYVYTNAVY